jgi:hypothetical protein
MIGSVAPAMKKRLSVPATWIARNKLRLLRGQEIDWTFPDVAPRGSGGSCGGDGGSCGGSCGCE